MIFIARGQRNPLAGDVHPHFLTPARECQQPGGVRHYLRDKETPVRCLRNSLYPKVLSFFIISQYSVQSIMYST